MLAWYVPLPSPAGGSRVNQMSTWRTRIGLVVGREVGPVASRARATVRNARSDEAVAAIRT
jgi:hypothetical protein